MGRLVQGTGVVSTAAAAIAGRRSATEFRVVAALWIAWGCGRIGFDPSNADRRDGGEGAPIDASADATPAARETWVLGEVMDATVTGVTSDTSLCSGSEESNNFGASAWVEGGDDCNGLLRFDLTAVPGDATVIEAEVSVWPVVVPTMEGLVRVRRMIEAWAEGISDGQPGTANYDQRLQGVDWTTRGARAPGSSEDPPFHEFHPGVYQAQRIPLPAPMVQAWLDDPMQNHGISFFGSNYGDSNSEHPHFLSSASTQAAQRPILTITFER